MAATKMIILNCVFREEEKGFSGHCKELDVCSQGKNVEEASNNLKEAVVLYVNSIEELGIRDQIFKERKIKVYSKKPKIQNVPVEVMAIDNNISFNTTQAIPCC